MIVQLIKVGLSSNAVTATIVFPVMIKLAQNHNLPYMGILMPTALSLSLAFILVTSGPTTVIPYTAGYFKISDMAKAGSIMTVATSIVIALTVFVIGSFTGLY
jgi:sodium-dependent dicarboxylate transporter 2/3/5